MRAFLRTSFVALALLLGSASATYAQESAGNHILLDNGHVLHGRLIDEGDQVLIRLGRGSQMRLPRTRIRGVGRSGHDLFLLQRRQLHNSDVEGRIELARWCLRNEQTDNAGKLLLELTRLAPRDPRVAYLDNQIRQVLQPPPVPSAKPAVQPAIAVEDPPADPIESLTRGQIADFTAHVQPVLLNHCSAAGCHGVVGKSDFKVLRPFSGHGLTQRMTNRNLNASLAYVNRADPAISKLLLAATEPHGGNETPILSGPRDESSLKVLRRWLESLKSPDAKPQDVADVNVQQATMLQRLARSEDATNHPLTDNADVERTGETTELNSLPSVKRTSPSLNDPYDPGAFNRHFFPERFEPLPPLQPAPQSQEMSRLNSPADSASKNATLLESTPDNARIPSGESQ